VSVSSQRDSQRALIAKEQRELVEMPQEELAELTQLYVDKGLTPPTARQVAHELTANNALAAVTAGRSAAQLHVGRIEPEAAGELAAGLGPGLPKLARADNWPGMGPLSMTCVGWTSP